MAERYVYLDNNATTPLHPRVKAAMVEALECFGNASSMHGFGRQGRDMIENARAQVASFMGAKADDLVFLGSGSEANNTVINIFARECFTCHTGKQNGHRIISTPIEHPCIKSTLNCLLKTGLKVDFVNVDSYGRVDLDHLEQLLKTKTRLVSIMMANNEIGTVMDIKKISKMVHDHGALFHTDAVQAAGKVPLDVQELDVDFLSMSAHKIYGPKGTGVLYVKEGVPFCSFINGGHQERGRRAGTENTIGIVGMGMAAQVLSECLPEEMERILSLKKKLKAGIEEQIPDTSFNGHQEECVPGTLNVSFKGVEGEAILLYLDMEGIAVSTGSACSSGSLEPSYVLLSLGLDSEMAHGSIRFSIGSMNTEEDIDYVLEKLPPIIKKLRGMSTAYIRRS